MKGFASDNNAGVHPEIISAINEVNIDHTIGYGDDKYTKDAISLIKKNLGKNCEVFFVFNGTAANVLGISAVTNSYQAVICAETAHLYEDECGAPEKFSGCKLLPVKTNDGKLTVDLIKTQMKGIGFEHHVQPKVISISQSTELGTVYSFDEIKTITKFAHQNNLYLHMDGARIYNAAVCLNESLKKITNDAGVDILSLGGTKNGMMYGEAIIFFNKKLTENFQFIRKQGMQLGSKMRFIAAQFNALFANKLWYKNASHANEMAQLLANKIHDIPQVKITQKVESNAVFATVPPYYVSELQHKYFFYEWDENKSEVRWMASFDTTQEDVINFVKHIKDTIGVEEEKKCHICENTNLELFTDKKTNSNYFSCKNCGYIFIDPDKIPTIEKEKERYLKHNNAEENSGYVEMFEEFIEAGIEPHNRGIKTALDFGCGPTPVLQKILESKGIKTDIYDPFFFPEKIYANKKYDLITCTEVFEHLYNPMAIMELFAAHLKNNGIIAIMTMFHPNDKAKFLDWWYKRDETHISFFNHHTLEYMASRFGLKVVMCSRKNICIIEKPGSSS